VRAGSSHDLLLPAQAPSPSTNPFGVFVSAERPSLLGGLRLDYTSTSSKPSLRSSRVWAAQTATTRIIG
jgi:hypothetical protein